MPSNDDQAEPIDGDALMAAIEQDRQDILFTRHVRETLAELRALYLETPEGDRVGFAAGQAAIAIAERISRAARRDLPTERAGPSV